MEYNLIDLCEENRLDKYKELFFQEIQACKYNPEFFAYYRKLHSENTKVENDCNSVISFVIGITDDEPDLNKLPFERFGDLPDIDIDFPDTKRQSVIKWLVKEYGDDHVCHVANVSTMQPRSAIGEFAKGLRISAGQTEELKDSIIERSAGDARAEFCMEDTFETTEVGRNFISKYPSMASAAKVEQHPSHTSVHAAGIIVCNEPIHNYCGVNSRRKKEKDENGNEVMSACNTGMVNRFSSEYFNLLKIDILGLRTLSILQDCAKAIGMKNEEYYSLSLDCKKTFDIFNNDRVFGIFQFEGQALRSLTEQMGVKEFNDIVAITALARPGALHSGGAARYVNYRLGKEEPIYYGKMHEEITNETFGIVVYQEQILKICRIIGNMSWEDVNKLRKGLSKSLGEEFFANYKDKFLEGAKENGYNLDDSNFIWNDVCYGGSYSFNLSHAVAYGMISYWTAYMKANHPAEFIVASLNNAKDNDSSVKILRDAIENDGLEYKAICPDTSDIIWSNVDGVVVGGLTNIHGIGVTKARDIIKMRNGEIPYTPGITKKLISPITPFDILWPCKHYWGDIYDNYLKYGLSEAPVLIKDVKGRKGEVFCFIGQLKIKKVRDLNNYAMVQKRDGKKVEGPHLELSLVIEDDSDSIMVEIGRDEFEEKATEIIENCVVDDDWFIIMAYVKWNNNRYMVVQEIFKLTEEFMES